MSKDLRSGLPWAFLQHHTLPASRDEILYHHYALLWSLPSKNAFICPYHALLLSQYISIMRARRLSFTLMIVKIKHSFPSETYPDTVEFESKEHPDSPALSPLSPLWVHGSSEESWPPTWPSIAQGPEPCFNLFLPHQPHTPHTHTHSHAHTSTMPSSGARSGKTPSSLPLLPAWMLNELASDNKRKKKHFDLNEDVQCAWNFYKHNLWRHDVPLQQLLS